MKLHVLDLGVIRMEMSNEVTLGDSKEVPEIPIHAFLLEDTPAGNVLFDTGCNPDGMKGEWPEALRGNPYVPPRGDFDILEHRLNEIGLKPDDIDVLIASHLHPDHAGAIYLFDKAKVYVDTAEFEKTMDAYYSGNLDLFHDINDIRKCIVNGIEWVLVNTEDDTKEYELCPGITILGMGSGHSYGMLALLVELEEGSMILAGDTIYSEEHFGPPARMAGICTDEKGYFETIEYIRDYAVSHDAVILYGHDMKQFRSLKKEYR